MSKSDLSVDDIINTMCDTLLRSISLDPDAVDELFEVLEREIQIVNIPLVKAEEKQQLISSLKERYAQFVIDGIEDPFYKAIIQDEILYNTKDGKQFICELIVGSAYRLAQFISALDPDSDLFGSYEDKDIPAIEYCNYDFDFSRRLTPYASRLGKTIAQKVEEKAMEALESLIVVPLQQAIVTLTESCKPPYNFGVVSFDNVGTAQANQFLQNEGVFDPNLFFDSLSANLSASEMCELLNGQPTRLTLYEVSLFLQTEFPDVLCKNK